MVETNYRKIAILEAAAAAATPVKYTLRCAGTCGLKLQQKGYTPKTAPGSRGIAMRAWADGWDFSPEGTLICHACYLERFPPPPPKGGA